MVLFLKRLLLEGSPLNYFINEFNKKGFLCKKQNNELTKTRQNQFQHPRNSIVVIFLPQIAPPICRRSGHRFLN